MLTGRAKAYSSSCPQAVTHRSTNRTRRRVTLFQPKRVTTDATPPTPVPWRRLRDTAAFAMATTATDDLGRSFTDRLAAYRGSRGCNPDEN